MIIAKASIKGFGKLKDIDIDMSGGINIITGPNEAGKSTMHMFIRSMLYGAPLKKRSGERSVYERMRPWKHPETYGGSLEIINGGGRYRIERDFNKAPDDIRVFDITEPEESEVADPEGFMSELLKNLSETAYVNTVSSGQLKARSGREMADEIRRYAANMSSTVNPGLNADRALMHLKEEKKRLELLLDHSAAREYNMTLGRIRAVESELKDPSMANRINEVKKAGETARENAERTARLIADNEIVISGYEEGLKAGGLRDSVDVEALKNKAETLYRDLEDKKKAVPVYTVTGIISIIIGMLCIACVSMDIFGVMDRLLQYTYVIMIIGAAAFVFGIAVEIEGISLRKKREALSSELRELIARHTGIDKAAGDIGDGMKLFLEKIDSYAGEALKLGDARTKKDGLIEELKGINREESLKADELKEQFDVSKKAEDRLSELVELKRKASILKRAVDKNEKIRDDIEAVELAEDIIGQLAENISKAAGTYINKEAGNMLKGFTGGAYDSLSAGSNYEIKVNSPDGMIPVEELSQGTMDQVYMAVRLAAVRFITGDSDQVPLILDDSFAMYDDDRLEKAIRFISDNFKGQMLIFTCQQREGDILDRAGISHRSIALKAS